MGARSQKERGGEDAEAYRIIWHGIPPWLFR
jgi:hypothetical protein